MQQESEHETRGAHINGQNYSSKNSRDYRVDMVTGCHNIGTKAYYRIMFESFNLPLDNIV